MLTFSAFTYLGRINKQSRRTRATTRRARADAGTHSSNTPRPRNPKWQRRFLMTEQANNHFSRPPRERNAERTEAKARVEGKGIDGILGTRCIDIGPHLLSFLDLFSREHEILCTSLAIRIIIGRHSRYRFTESTIREHVPIQQAGRQRWCCFRRRS